MRVWIIILACVGLLMVAPGKGRTGQGEAAVESITFQRGEGGSEMIHFQLNGAHIPKIFTLKGDNPRLVLDFHNTSYGGNPRIAAKGGELVQNIRIGVHREPRLKTRVVVDLTTERDVDYTQDFLVHKNILTISIAPSDQLAAAESSASSMDAGRALPGTAADRGVAVPPTASRSVCDQADAAASDEPLFGDTPSSAAVTPGKQTDTSGDEFSLSDPLLVDVSFDNTSNKGEMVLFKLNDFYPPTVSAIEQGTPRIVCDFINMRMAKEVQKLIEADGQFIDKIRVAKHQDPPRVRVVLDLFPSRDYDLQQVFFKDENLFVLIVNVLDADAEARATE